MYRQFNLLNKDNKPLSNKLIKAYFNKLLFKYYKKSNKIKKDYFKKHRIHVDYLPSRLWAYYMRNNANIFKIKGKSLSFYKFRYVEPVYIYKHLFKTWIQGPSTFGFWKKKPKVRKYWSWYNVFLKKIIGVNSL